MISDPAANSGKSRDGAQGFLPLVEAKLAPPRLRLGLLPRRRVLGVLGAGAEAQLTVVAAPPGYGKTTAVQAWCASQDRPVAWLTLDAADNDPVRLWIYIATAMDRVRAGTGRMALQRLRMSGGSIEDPIDELLNRAASLPGGVVVVLDDFHEVAHADALRSLEYALRHLPANVSVIMLTRSDPAVGLARMRARGTVAEVRAADLAFTVEETRELVVERHGIPLDTDEIGGLWKRTEGWPAAIYLAALWLSGVENPHQALREFRGDHRFVADYLTHEVISHLGGEARAFLLHVCVLGRFTGELCDAVLGGSDGTEKLGELERTNLFVTGLGAGGWFRVHPLLGEFGGFQLDSLEPGAKVAIHGKAAGWLRAHGLADEAAQHAAAAEDYDFLGSLLAECHLQLLRQGEYRTLLHWTRVLPEEEMVRRPEVAVAAASSAAHVGHLGLDVRRYLHLADRGRRASPGRDTAYLQAASALIRGFWIGDDVGAAVEAARRALLSAEEGAGELVLPALTALTEALYLGGHLDAAWAAGMRAMERPEVRRQSITHAEGRAKLALCALDYGRLRLARTHVERARSILGSLGSSRNLPAANVSLAVGLVHAEENNLPEAERHLVFAERFFEDEVPVVKHAWTLVALARIRCRRGRVVEAEATMRAARTELDQLADGGRLPSLAALVESELDERRRQAAGGTVLEFPSEAELAVLRLLGSDLSAREIGSKLFISLNTVRTHTRSLYAKLGVRSREGAVARAGELGLLGGTESLESPSTSALEVRARDPC